MMRPSRWIPSWLRKNVNRTQPLRNASPSPTKLGCESLEDRTAPATSITVIPGLAGSGSLDSILTGSGGTILVSDGGASPGSISTGALASIPGTNNISITAAGTITFNDLASQGGTLSLATSAGRVAAFTASSGGSITFLNTGNTLSLAGGSLSLNASASLTSGQLATSGGNLTLNASTGTVSQTGTANAGAGTVNVAGGGNVTVDALTGGTVTLTSTGGTLASATGSSRVTASAQVNAFAATGINLRTQTAALQANNSVSGALTVVNTGSLTIAGPVAGAGSGAVSVSAPSNGASLTVNAGVSSGTGNVTLSGADGLTVSASGSVTTGGGLVTLNADANLGGGGVFSLAAGGTVNSGGGAVTVQGTDVSLGGALSAGGGVATIQNSTAGLPIDLGTDTPGALGLTDTELDNITAGAVRVGSLSAGAINVSAAITPAGTTLLALLNNAAVNETGSITVPNLRVTSAGPVNLGGANQVGTLAGSASAGFTFNNQTNPLTIGVVDLVTGLSAINNPISLTADAINIQQVVSAGSTGVVSLQPFTTASVITVGNGATGFGVSDAELGLITAGVVRIGNAAVTGTLTIDGTVIRHAGYNTLDLITGNTSAAAVSQTAGLSVANLAVQTPGGGVQLTNAGNDVDTLAALAAQNVLFTDTNALVIGTVDGVVGVSSAANVGLVAGGGVTVNSTLTAGGVIGISATGPVTQGAGGALTAPSGIVLGGTGPVTLNNPNNSTPTLAANISNGLSYTNAGALGTGAIAFVGVASAIGLTTTNNPISVSTVAGNLTVNPGNPINAGNGAVSLTAGGMDSTFTNQATITGGSAVLTADRIDLQAATNVTVGSGPNNFITLRPTGLSRPVNLDNAAGDPVGELRLAQSELNTLVAGAVRVGRIDDIADLTIKTPVSNPAGWDVLHLITGGDILLAGTGVITVPNLAAEAGSDVVLSSPASTVTTLAGKASGTFDYNNTGNLIVGTVDGVAGITDTATGAIVSIAVEGANNLLTVNSPISNAVSAGSAVDLIADDMAINAAVSAGPGAVLINPFTGARPVDLGTNAPGALGLTDTELDKITAQTLAIGSTATSTGNVAVTSPITQFGSGYNVLSIGTKGSVTTTGTGSITGANLTIGAGAGIGTGGTPLATQVTNFAFNNSTSGVVNVLNIGGFTIANIAPNTTSGNAAVGQPVTLATTGGPITFAVNTTSAGTLLATATETGSNGDDATVNAGVTVQATGNVTIRGGDNVVLQTGSVVTSTTGTVSLVAGFGDTGDNIGALVLNGTINIAGGQTLTLQALQDITLGAPLNYATSTVNLTSTKGAIIDGNDPPTGTNNVTAATLNLMAATGIGSGPGANAPIEVSVSTLTAVNSTSGDIRVVNLAGNLTASATNTGGGPVTIANLTPGSILTVGLTGVVSNGGAITLTADDMTIGNPVNAGTGANAVVTLLPVTTSRPIQLGVNSVGSTLGLTDAELDKITAATALRIGNQTVTGNITVEAPISQGIGYANLSLTTAGSISENPGIPITGSTLNLALRGATGVNANVSTNDVVSIAGATTALGAAFTYFDANGLTIGTVDGVSGVLSNNGNIDIETFGVGGLAVAPSVAVNSTGGTVTLIARGAGQVFNLNAGASVASGGGTLLVQSDNMKLDGTAINAGPGRAILKPFSLAPAVQINLGGPDVSAPPSTLGLTAGELAILTASILQIGDADSGNITVSAAVATPGAQTLSLQTGGGINEVGGSITANNLAIRAVNAVNMTGTNEVAGTLAASVSTGGQSFKFNDQTALTIGTADGLDGISTNDGLIEVVTSNGNLTLNAVPVSSKNAAIRLVAGTTVGLGSTLTNGAAISNLGNNPITLEADRMALSAGTIVAGGGGRVTLQATSPGRPIDLGSTTDLAAALELSNTELSKITTTGPLQIGHGTEGAINVSSSISIGAGGTGTLSLVNNGPITETGIITAGNLRVSSAGPVDLIGANKISGMIAGALTTSLAAFNFNNAGNVTIGNVDGVTGITTVNGPITVTTSNGNLTATNNITAGTAAIVLTAGGAENMLTVTPLQAFGSSVLLTADRISLAPGVANLINVGVGTIGIIPFTPNRDILLGTAGDPTGTLNLTDGELDSLFAGLVRIGAGVGTPVNPVAGDINVTDVITQGPGYTTLSLAANDKITETGSGSLGVTNLAVRGTDGVELNSPTNTVTNLAGTTTGSDFSFTNGMSLLVNTVDGLSGIMTGGGRINLTVGLAGGLLGIQNPVLANNADVTLTADDMDLQSQVSGGTQIVTLAPANNPRDITLGTNAGGTLGLTDAELDRITAGILRIGSPANSGDINVAAAITATSGYNTLSLVTAGAIVDNTVTDQVDITVANLSLSAAAGIGDADDLDVAVTNLAANNTTSGNIQVSNTGALTLPAAGVDGTAGVTNLGPGAINLNAAGGALTVSNQVLGSGGGGISLVTSGAGGAFTLSATGSVTASGGNGNVLIDTSAATSGGTVTVNNGPATPDVGASGSGNITILANTGLTLGAGATVGTGTGTVLFQSNVGNAGGTSNITLSAGSQIRTDGDVVLNADPDANGTGGTIVFGNNVLIADNAGMPVNAITLVAATDLTLIDLRADTLVSVTSSGGNLRDDGTDATFLQAPNITLSAARAIGGNAVITVNETLTRTGNYLGAVDFDLTGGALTITQTGAGGNVQLHRVNGTFANSALPGGFAPVGANSQLALFGDAGITVDAPITLTAVNNANLLIGSAGVPTPGPVNITAAVTNNGATAPVAFVTAGGVVNVNAPVTAGGNVNFTAAGNAPGNGVVINANVTASGSASTITADANRDVLIPSATAVIATTAANGGGVTLTAARDLPGSPSGGLGVVTMANGSTVSTAANNSPITINAGQTAGAGGDIALATVDAGTGAVNVRSFNGAIGDANAAGTTNVTGGAINLQASGSLGIDLDVFTSAPGSAGLTASTTNDPISIRGQANTQLQITNVNAGTADVTLIANNGNLTNRSPNDLVADVVGNTVTLTATGTGTIGLAGPTFFEIDAKNLNAATTNKILWIADVAGGVGINSVNAGSAVAVLQAANGAVTSATVDGLPDVVGSAVVLLGAAVGGSFGTSAASPLEVATNTLNANLAGTGSLSVRDTGGGLTVTQAVTGNGDINLEAAGATANLTLTEVVASGTATARATGAVAGTPGGATDVTAGAFAVLGATGVGSLASPLETSVGQLAASVGTGGVFVTQTGQLVVGSVAGVNGITATGGRVLVNASGSLTVAQNVTTPADITLASGGGSQVTVLGPAVINSTANGVTITADGGLNVGAGATVTAAGPVTATVGTSGASASAIAGTVSGGSPSILGSSGADTLLVDYGAGASLPVGLTFVPGGGADVVAVSDASGPVSNHVYDINSTQIVRDGATGSPISFTGTPSLVVTGGPADDVFNVAPGALTAVTIDGQTPTPPAAPGDALNVDLTGVDATLSVTNTPTGLEGGYSFSGGVQPVNFTGIETLGSVPFGLSVTNTDNQTTAVPGTPVTYTATVTNTGTLGVSGVNFTNVFSSFLTNISWSASFSPGSSGNAFGTGQINEILTIAGGGSVTYTITGTIDPSATGTLVSTASVNTAGITDNNSADDTATDTNTLTPVADVSVTISSGVSNVTAGGTVTYTIVVSNSGPSTAAGVTVADLFPAAFVAATFTSTANGGATGNTASGSGNINDVLTLPPGSTVTYTAAATTSTDAGGTLANTVTATVPQDTTDPNPTNNSATDSISIVATSADLAVAITTNSGTVGTNLTYTITVTNTGPGQADGVVVTDFLPTGVTLVSAVPSQGTVGVISGGTAISANLGSLGSGASATVVVTFTTNRAGVRSTNAAVTSTTPDPVASNNTATASLSVNPFPSIIVVGAGPGGSPLVQVFDAQSGRLIRSFLAFAQGATGGVSVAQGDVNGDGVPEIIAGAGDGGSPLINVFDLRTGGLIKTFFAYAPDFRGGVHVAAGDVNGDGKADILAGAGNTGAPQVVVFDGVNGTVLRSFYAFAENFRGGVQVSSGDVNNDGFADIVTGAGVGGAPHATVFDGRTGILLRSFFAYSETFRGGVQVAAADVNGDGLTDIIAGAGLGGAPQITVFDGATARVLPFFAFDDNARGGVNVSTADVNGDGVADIVGATGPGTPPMIRVFAGTNFAVLDSFSALDPNFFGGVFVG